MSDAITYRYATPSQLIHRAAAEELLLAHYSEVQKIEAPCFFHGSLTDPFITARCLITLANVVQSSFSMSPARFGALKDPVVTAGNERVRFEGFSQCAGVYGRVDVLPDGYKGEFPATGTTNVDFNQPMIAALGSVRKNENVLLSVGQQEVGLYRGEGKVIERKVPLPVKWIKGLTTVQVFLSRSEKIAAFNRLQAQQLLRSIPAGVVKNDLYLVVRGNKPVFSPIRTNDGICVGGAHRLRLLEPLLAYISELRVFADEEGQSSTWQLYFGGLRFSFSLSRSAWRGFSGEGAALESLLEDVPDHWMDLADKYGYANQAFNPAMMALEEGLSMETADNLATRLSAMGLLGFDLDDNQFFYRRLPFKLARILSLNPRLKDAEKLLAENKVEIVHRSAGRVEALVMGSGVKHSVVLDGQQERCTCTWFSQHQGERGPCKHVLAVKKMIQ